MPRLEVSAILEVSASRMLFRLFLSWCDESNESHALLLFLI